MSLAYLFLKIFMGLYDEKIYQVNYFEAIYEVVALRNYAPSVSGILSSLYRYSIQEVYLSSAARKSKSV